MEHCFREGWRTPDDFVRHFPAQTIMVALKSAPELRVAILSAATGMYEEILRRKTLALAAEDLSLALEEGTLSSLQLMEVFSAEERVRYLDPRQIWDFLADDQFWRFDPEATEEQRQGAAERMSFTLTQAVQEKLVTLRDILEGLTYEAVADSLSPHELRTVVRHALVKGRDGIGLNEKVLLEVLPLDKLVRSMPLEHIWSEVVVRRLAVPCGLTDLAREERRASQPERPAEATAAFAGESAWQRRLAGPPPLPPELARGKPASEPGVATHRPTFGDTQLLAGMHDYTEEDDEMTTAAPPVVAPRESLLPPPLHSAGPSSSPGSAPRLPATDDFNQPLPSAVAQPAPLSMRPGALPADDFEQAERQRQRITEHLRAIGRLPPRHASLPASVLRSIDAMYALLPSATDDIQRKSVIRQAFANDHHLRVALLGLIELMDSSVDTSDPVIQEAKIEALIKILLFEEQRRKENGRVPAGSFGASPFGASRSQGSASRSSEPRSSESRSSAPPSSGRGDYRASAMRGGRAQGLPSHVATQRPPPPVLGDHAGYQMAGYAGAAYPAAAPLPNVPADPPPSTRRHTLPPPLPPSYSRG